MEDNLVETRASRGGTLMNQPKCVLIASREREFAGATEVFPDATVDPDGRQYKKPRSVGRNNPVCLLVQISF